MGRAAIVIVPILFVVCALALIGGVAVIARWTNKPIGVPKKMRQNAELADEAQALFASLLYPTNINDLDLISERNKAKIKSWAEKYRKVNS